MLTSTPLQNHNPLAGNGSASAWALLSPIWGGLNITVFGTKFRGDMSWLNSRNDFGAVVDRFRWEGGCIVEHVSLHIVNRFCAVAVEIEC